MVLFDLPVSTKSERKAASKFRLHLTDLGFAMVQFSVYMKHCAGKEQAESLSKKIKNKVPKMGNVKILRITDKQFENIEHLGCHEAPQIKHEQYALF